MLREQKPDEIGLGPELRLRLIGANSKYWLRLAEETRSEAEQITDPRSKQMMLNVAETYNGMARRAEKKGRDPHQNAGIPAPAMCPPAQGFSGVQNSMIPRDALLAIAITLRPYNNP